MTLFPCLIVALAMLLTGVFLGMVIGKEPASSVPDAATEVTVQPDAIAEIPEDFTVTGKPRKPTWKQRRRELEAAARTKRKQIEEWRD